jgi:hypothetical protein
MRQAAIVLSGIATKMAILIVPKISDKVGFHDFAAGRAVRRFCERLVSFILRVNHALAGLEICRIEFIRPGPICSLICSVPSVAAIPAGLLIKAKCLATGAQRMRGEVLAQNNHPRINARATAAVLFGTKSTAMM